MGGALAVWALGTAWALCCLWLWRIGPNELIPVALLGALLTLWGWRSVRWLHWFPPVAIVASLLDLAAPLPAAAAPAGLGYVGMVAFAAVLLACARLLALGRMPIAGRPHEVSATLIGALGLGLALATSGSSARACAAALVAFAAAVAMAARPTGERRVWVAFPLTALLVGAHAMWAASSGLIELLAQSRVADFEWGAPHALLQLLVLTLPVTAGLALDAGPSLRTIARVALVVGAAGLVLHVLADRWLPPSLDLAALTAGPATMGIAAATLVFLALAVGRLGTTGGIARPRWLGLAFALLVASMLLVWGRLLATGTAQVLVAFGIALASAVRTAERRARALGLAPRDWPLATAARRAPAAVDATPQTGPEPEREAA
jgi:hypothetical protein